MKNVKLGMFILTAVVLAACGKKGGGGGGGGGAPGPVGPVVGAAGACTLDPSGNYCAGNVAPYGMVPGLNWEGPMTVTEPTRYRQFLIDNRLCGQQQPPIYQNPNQYPNQYPNQFNQCTPGPQFIMAVRTGRNGGQVYLPNQATFAIQPQLNTWGHPPILKANARAFPNIANNGFQLAYRSPYVQQGYYPQQPYPQQPSYPYPQPGYPQPGINNSTLQIVLTYAGPQNILSAVVLYQGIVIATGQIISNQMPMYANGNVPYGQQPPYNQQQVNANAANAPAVAPYRYQ